MNATPNIAEPNSSRIASIDLIRGAVMILMAIDHVRVFSGVPAGGPSAGVFFTRWITHFCAPAFIFLAGTSSFLYGRRHDSLSRFLVTRGLWLVFLELTILRLSWTFNLDFAHYEMAGVLWVIGWCMVLMAGLVKLPYKVVGIVGLLIVGGHNLLDATLRSIIFSQNNSAVPAVWKIAYVGFFAGPISAGPNGPNLIVLYSIIPWIGVMAAGYAFGSLLVFEKLRRDRLCYALGTGAVVLFILLRGFNLYGDPFPWRAAQAASNGRPGMSGFFSFLNATKYPASLSFLLMTLGPTIALIPLLEGAQGAVAKVITVFGRVPFFYYVLHIPLIHFLALVTSFILHGEVNSWLFLNHPMGNPPPPEGYTWSLWTLYAVWGVAVAILYVPCRRFAELKAKRKDWWLSYV